MIFAISEQTVAVVCITFNTKKQDAWSGSEDRTILWKGGRR